MRQNRTIISVNRLYKEMKGNRL